jgi:RNA recognition motif-containing protein
MTKRQRELDQKDRVKMREARRADRRERSAERAASGQVGPPMGEAMAPLGDYPAEPVQAPPAMRLKEKFQNMGVRLYVGNLSYDTNAEMMRALFAEIGQVADVHIVMDRDSGRPRGFAFVTMASRADADTAIREMNGRVFDGRPLRVNEAEDRPRGGGGGGGRGGPRY